MSLRGFSRGNLNDEEEQERDCRASLVMTRVVFRNDKVASLTMTAVCHCEALAVAI
ncbi:MAG: hypothetical protein Q7U00_06505 [Sulfurimonas sp.]|nr:hypothetical protein [Sulfurimonas sp.]